MLGNDASMLDKISLMPNSLPMLVLKCVVDGENWVLVKNTIINYFLFIYFFLGRGHLHIRQLILQPCCGVICQILRWYVVFCGDYYDDDISSFWPLQQLHYPNEWPCHHKVITGHPSGVAYQDHTYWEGEILSDQ